MPPLDGEQLGAEAAELAAELNGEAPPPGGEAPPPGAEPEPQPEFIPNIAPKISGALKKARSNPLVRRMTPPRVLAVFSDDICDALGDALGPVITKHSPSFAPSLANFFEEWGEEINAALVLYAVGSAVMDAMQPEADQVPPQQQQPGAGDPPNPAASMPPVEPAR